MHFFVFLTQQGCLFEVANFFDIFVKSATLDGVFGMDCLRKTCLEQLGHLTAELKVVKEKNFMK